MNFHLSTNVIADTARALAAMETLAAGPGSELRGILSPMIHPDRDGVLELLIKNAFVRLVAALSAYTDAAVLGDESATADPGSTTPGGDLDTDTLLSIDLRIPDPHTATFATTLRRNLEETAALYVLSLCASASGAPATARHFDEIAAIRLASVTTALTAAKTFIRPAYYF